jgi:anti-sigma factor RsiW
MTCQECVELLAAYLDGALTPDEHARVQAHLDECDGCTAYVQQLRVTVRALGALPPEPPDEATRDALLRAFRDLRA